MLMLKYLFFKSIVLLLILAFLFSYIVIEGFIEDLF